MSTQRLVMRLSTWLDSDLSLGRLLALALLLAALNSIALGLTSVVRGLDVDLLFPIATLGAFIGWGLAASSCPAWLASSAALLAGIATIMVRIGRLGEALVTLPWLLLSLLWQAIRWSLAGPPPDGTPLGVALLELWIGTITLLSRLSDWLLGFVAGEPVFDLVAVALVWALALWLVSVWAGWVVRRHDRVLLGLLPAGALLVVSMAYGSGNFAFLLLLLGLTWPLRALVSYTARERRWQTTGTDFALDIRTEMTFMTVWLAAALVALAQITPPVSVQQAAELAQRLIWGRPLAASPVARSLGLQPQPAPPTAFDKVRVGGLPRHHLLGSGPELSQQVVMIIRPGASPPHFEPPHYWRSLTYDRYTGRGWLTGKTETAAYVAGEPLQQTLEISETSTLLLTQQVQFVGDAGGLLHVAGTLMTADQPYEVAWRKPGDVFGATIAAATYQVESAVPAVDETRLRVAGTLYPGWVRQRYLALPETVPTRVLALARDLTATQPTPYDRARAIESYLRTFPYNLNLPTPPRDRDVADYFLFDLRRGYCDYYATAMVVLARAAGLPARLVIGYAGGSFDPANGRYLVTEAEAHAWPEIYFPDYGWIEFEPTAARPLPERPAEPVLPVLPEPEAAWPKAVAGQTGWTQHWGWGFVAVIAGLALGGVVWSVADAWRLRRLPPAAAVARLYERLQRAGNWLAVSTTAGDTPYEFSAALAERLSGLAQAGRWQGFLAPTGLEAQGLAGLYVRTAYSAHRPDPVDQRQAIQTWRRLRWRLGLAWVHLRASRFKGEQFTFLSSKIA